jgi:hypothetical protein
MVTNVGAGSFKVNIGVSNMGSFDSIVPCPQVPLKQVLVVHEIAIYGSIACLVCSRVEKLI